MNKICKLCNQDCSSKVRYKDEAGQYTCKECFDEFSLDKEKNKEIITTLSHNGLIKEFKEININVYNKTSSSLLVIRLLRCYKVKIIPNIVNLMHLL